MNKLIFKVFAVILIAATACGIVYYRRSINNGTANIGGIDNGYMTDTTKTPQEYLTIINQYSKENARLKSELANNKSKYDSKIAESQEQIISLQEEIANLTESDTALINEKNENIRVLKEYIATLQNELSETSSVLEDKIDKLTKLVAEYEVKVIETIQIPEGFVFDSLGFNVIDNESFVFYSKSHSCNLYYYSFITKQIETIQVKGSDFSNFFKLENYLFFRTTSLLYVYDFTAKEVKLLGACPGNVGYTYDNENVYIIGSNYTYCVYNRLTKEYNINFSQAYSDDVFVDVCLQDDYIVVLTKVTVSGNSSYFYLFFNKNTFEFTRIPDPFNFARDSLHCFQSINGEVYSFISSSVYKFDLTEKSCDLFYTFSYSMSSLYVKFLEIEDKFLVISSSGVYLHTNDGFKQMLTHSNFPVNKIFYSVKIDDNTYYFCGFGNGLYKFDLQADTYTLLSNAGKEYLGNIDINGFEIITCVEGHYVLDMSNGSFEFIRYYNPSISNSRFNNSSGASASYVEFDNYLLFSTGLSCSTIYFFDKDTNNYGLFYDVGQTNGLPFLQFMVINNRLYILGNKLYVFDSKVSKTIPTVVLNVDYEICSLKHGIFYSKVGTMDGSTVYVKYRLQNDGSFTKELAVV